MREGYKPSAEILPFPNRKAELELERIKENAEQDRAFREQCRLSTKTKAEFNPG